MMMSFKYPYSGKGEVSAEARKGVTELTADDYYCLLPYDGI